MILSLITSIIFLICGGILYYKAHNKKLEINKQQQQYNKELLEYKITLEKEIEETQQKKDDQQRLAQQALELKQQRQKEFETELQNQQLLIQLKVQKAQASCEHQIENIHSDLAKIRQSAQKQKEQLTDKINKLKNSLSAGVEARLREQEKKEKINFYKLSITDADLADVKMLENLKTSFHKPVVLSKLIWTQYFQKQMTELCDRVLGKNTICGIYKITNLLTEQCYIGQSVNIADRWKQHCKCGLGIQASATNVLYNAMQKDGVWNFSFELLEECPRNLLNEKEKFWIQMYQSNNFGFNSTKGGN